MFVAPHMDPAVVAAHPMPKQSLVRPSSSQTTPDSSGLPPAGFGGTTFGDQPTAYGDQHTTDMSSVPAVASHAAKVDQVIYSQATKTKVTKDYSGSGYKQSNISHSLQTDNLFTGTVTATGDSGIHGKGSSDSGTISHKQYDIPPQLPMPPRHEGSNTQVRCVQDLCLC